MTLEESEAREHGLTLRVYRLQQRLRRLPLNPRSESLRKARDEVSKHLIRCARADRCIPKINLMAGIMDEQ
jgi:hypothetical protein